MDGLPISTVITMLVSVGVAAGGIIIGQMARVSAARSKEGIMAIDGRMKAVETACTETKEFISESRKDRSDLHKDFGDIRGDLRVLIERQENIAEKLEQVHKKLFNGTKP
ncbi:hypothetical protein [Acidithiobacillus sp.]|uniref:hypothetical protein n=1 Tax=Acidithiobacillus sp. TaxID=1872118 RepID=UPI00258A1D71|nr:hypothetical protein [Acidithiobacillus sp.]MDD5375739.1 hypothetical protein [Acidithiobacillus sp.]